jgi:ABC-type transport system involved in multi-copper enzyme maturation permease subunit
VTTIIRREILDHLQSLQFLILLLLSLILFLANGLLFARRYDEQATWYSRTITAIREKPSTVSTELYPEPEQLAFIAEAGDNQAPAGYTLGQMGVLRPLPAGPRNFRLPVVPDPDWSFIIKIIFSLYAILIGYDAIAGEKESGTLRQMLSGPLGRTRLLIAKYAAVMVTLAIPLLCGMVVSLITVSVSVPRVLTPAFLSGSILTFFLASVYLSLFAFLSLFLSSLIHNSSLVLLTLLVVWIFFTIIIPNTAGILSEEISDIPSEFSIAKELGPSIQKEVWSKIGILSKMAEKGEIKTEEELKRRTDQAFGEGQQSLISFYDSYEKALLGRAAVARMLSRLSPTALFEYATEDIAGTGIHREERFLREARAYSEVYDRYILSKTGKLVGTSGWAFGTFIEVNGKGVFIGSPRAEEYRGDTSDFPRFVESPRPLGEGVQKAIMDAAGLLLWNIVLAGAALGAIMRSDVR